MDMPDSQLFTIAKISEMVKVPKHTLRFWEREFNGSIVPLRTQGGQRRYTSENVAVIEMIKRLREKGLSLSEIKRTLGNGGKDGKSSKSKIDLLANRVAEVVKTEVYNFFVIEEWDK